jgi:hypothetical protein
VGQAVPGAAVGACETEEGPGQPIAQHERVWVKVGVSVYGNVGILRSSVGTFGGGHIDTATNKNKGDVMPSCQSTHLPLPTVVVLGAILRFPSLVRLSACCTGTIRRAALPALEVR